MKRIAKLVSLVSVCLVLLVCSVFQVSAVEITHENVYDYCDDHRPRYAAMGGILEGGLYSRHYNMDEVTDETLRSIIRQCILDWNWHLNPDDDGLGVDCYFVQLSGVVNYRSAQLNFVQVNGTYPGDYYGKVDAITIHLDNEGNQISDEDLFINDENWYSTYTELYAPSLPKLANGSFDSAKVRGIINHEIGHAFGLYENDQDNGTIMYPNTAYRTANVPTAADLNGIRSLYYGL